MLSLCQKLRKGKACFQRKRKRTLKASFLENHLTLMPESYNKKRASLRANITLFAIWV
jgi:hypothetical protein